MSKCDHPLEHLAQLALLTVSLRYEVILGLNRESGENWLFRGPLVGS